MHKSVGLCLLLSVVAAPCCFALEPEEPFNTLMKEGYDIKATALSSQGKDAKIFVTLQKGPSVAVCTFSVGQWSYLNDDVLKDPTRCDVR